MKIHWDRGRFITCKYLQLGICIHKTSRKLFNLLLFPIKVHGVWEFVSHPPPIKLSTPQVLSHTMIPQRRNTFQMYFMQFLVWIKSINSDPDPQPDEMRSMNGRDNEVIMCVLSRLIWIWLHSAHAGGGRESVIIIVIARTQQRVRANSTPL